MISIKRIVKLLYVFTDNPANPNPAKSSLGQSVIYLSFGTHIMNIKQNAVIVWNIHTEVLRPTFVTMNRHNTPPNTEIIPLIATVRNMFPIRPRYWENV